MAAGKTSFALFFGQRGFFPGSLVGQARKELRAVLKDMGHKSLMLPEDATRFGAVETTEEAEKYAAFLRENRGKYGGVILCLPNFGDESGAVMALRDAGVPVLIVAYPDELDKMGLTERRDSFCGKLSVMNYFTQNGLPFTALMPHVVHPRSPLFRENVDFFDRVCRVVAGMKRVVIGAIGARTTPFKTVRIDEVALQRRGITVETVDLAEVFGRMEALSPKDRAYKAKARRLKEFAEWYDPPEHGLDHLTRFAVVLDQLAAAYRMDAMAVRCWPELQARWRIAACALMAELGERGVPAACEVDVGGAIAMRALSLASDGVPTLLDWNNNYGDDPDKCILFHCGCVPPSLMSGGGKLTDHGIIANALGKGCGYGCCVGRIAPRPFTFGGMTTNSGRLEYYLGQGEFTDDAVPEDFFGAAGVARVENLQETLLYLGQNGHHHHVAVAPGHVVGAVREALTRYLGCEAACL